MDQPHAPHATIRRLWEADRELFRGHLLRLDPESRHDRFNGGASDELLNRYVDHCFAPGDVIVGAFIDGELRGAGELRPLPADPAAPPFFAAPRKAEAAFSIERPYRRRGLGVQLFERLMRAAAAHRIGEIDFTCAADNRAMQGLRRQPDHRPADRPPRHRLLDLARGGERRERLRDGLARRAGAGARRGAGSESLAGGGLRSRSGAGLRRLSVATR